MQQRVNKESIPVGSTLRFLGHIMVAGSALFAIWIYLGPLYLASLVPPLNSLAGQADAALNFAQHRDILALSFRQLDNSWHHLRLTDHFQFNMLAAMAVFLAVESLAPCRSTSSFNRSGRSSTMQPRVASAAV